MWNVKVTASLFKASLKKKEKKKKKHHRRNFRQDQWLDDLHIIKSHFSSHSRKKKEKEKKEKEKCAHIHAKDLKKITDLRKRSLWMNKSKAFLFQ